MNTNTQATYDTIIIGGSYAGLSAAMALGRALRKVLIIDSGQPCNRFTPHSHNFITQDGESPAAIAEKAKKQVMEYPTVSFNQGLAIDGNKTDFGFEISTQDGQQFKATKLIFATGVKDIMPKIKGFADCWGKSVIHCPYCHGYEVKNEVTGILANGDKAFHYAKLIRNWTKDLTLFTNGDCTLSDDERSLLSQHNIPIVEKQVSGLAHTNGQLKEVFFSDGSTSPLTTMYAGPDFEQHCTIPEKLGCELTDHGHLKVDMLQNTTVPGIMACGDCTVPFRSVAYAVSSGNIAGAALNNQMIEEKFK